MREDLKGYKRSLERLSKRDQWVYYWRVILYDWSSWNETVPTYDDVQLVTVDTLLKGWEKFKFLYNARTDY